MKIIIDLDRNKGTAEISSDESSLGVFLDGLNYDTKRLGDILGQYIQELEARINKSKSG